MCRKHWVQVCVWVMTLWVVASGGSVMAQELEHLDSETKPVFVSNDNESTIYSYDPVGHALMLPISFDSIRTVDFLPYFQTPTISYFPQKKETKTVIDKRFEERKNLQKSTRRTLYAISLSNPELIQFYDLKEYDPSAMMVKYELGNVRISGLDTLLTHDTKIDRIHLSKKKSENSPWKMFGTLSLQFSQYYVTDNWYKGGTPNTTFLSIFEYNIDYQKKRMLWENDFDVKVGFYNTAVDTIRAFRVNNDVFKIASRFNYQTIFSKKTYYSAELSFNTSLFTGYGKTNSNEVLSAFLSPTRTFISMGVDYRHSKKTSVRLSPVAYKLLTLSDDRIDPLTVGVDTVKKYCDFWGYMIQGRLNWSFSKEINITSKLDFFSSYNFDNIEVDWETVGRFVLNRYLSTRLSLIMRFDNTPQDKPAKIQIQEQLSFGFNYTFHNRQR